MSYDPASAEAQRGAAAETAAAALIQRRGGVVLPVYSSVANGDDKAPLVLLPDGTAAVGPDILCWLNHRGYWIDVKGKTVPTWRRNDPGPRWEHGIDLANFCDYERVGAETGVPVWLLVHEDRSPLDALAESAFVPPGGWLAIALAEARRLGEHRKDWPGGAQAPARRGRRQEGGWLWARKDMRVWCPGTAE